MSITEIAAAYGIPVGVLEDRYADLVDDLFGMSGDMSRAESMALLMLESEARGVRAGLDAGLPAAVLDGLDAISVGVLIASGLTGAALAARAGELRVARLEKVEETEVRAGEEIAARTAAERGGSRWARWVTQEDDLVESLCEDLAALGWVPIDEMTESPPLHPHCRCSVEYR